MWRLRFIRFVALALLFGAGLPADSNPRDKRQGDCSVGEVDRELSEDDRLEVGGIYLLPEPVNCNGSLVSWHSCFFYSNLRPDTDRYRMSVRVYRQEGDSYRFSSERATSFSVTREGNDTKNCNDLFLANPIEVQEGDRIGLQVFLDCARRDDVLRCPLYPTLNRSGASPVFHLPDRNNRNDIDVRLVENETYYTNISINLRASIEAVNPTSTTHTSVIAIAVPVAVGVSLAVVLILALVIFARHKKQKASESIVLEQPQEAVLESKQLIAYIAAIPTERNEAYMTNADVITTERNEAYMTNIDTENDNEMIADTGHQYELDNECPYWEPATLEDELRLQLVQFHIVEVPTEELKTSDHLGSGHFGTVTKGIWHRSESETEVAVKILNSGSTEEERVKFLQEAAIMGQFKHPNILKIHGIVTLAEPMMIVSEIMHKGDLHHYLLSITPSYGDSDLPAMLLSFCRQVAAGMGYLAHKSFVHRDLAARNILVSMDDVCKIADFGLSRDLRNEDFYISHGGKIPVKWTAPEALNFRKYSTASDVWSYGILLYEIWALGRVPYHDFTTAEVMHNLESGYRLPPPSGCPRAIYQLMLQCWHPEAESRPTFFDILLVLQRPDFQVLKWKPEDEAAYSQEARTLGSLAGAGKELYAELQNMYSAPTDTL